MLEAIQELPNGLRARPQRTARPKKGRSRRPQACLVRPGTPSSFLLLVAMPGAPSSILAPRA